VSACTPDLVIKAGTVLCQNGELCVSDVLLEGGRIKQIGVNLKGEAYIDGAGAYVLPGLIDTHTGGIGFIELETGALRDFAEAEAACGATTLYANVGSSPDHSARIMERHRRETNELTDVPQIAGFRLELPYLARPGAATKDRLAPITPENTQLLLDAGGGHIKIWDISPELPGAAELIRGLSSRGIVCSICHTDATIAQARTAVEAGARLVTHMFDTFVLPEMTDPGVYPAGLVDYLLIEDRVTCGIIADGTHVHPLLVEKAFRCKTPRRVAFVTDATFASGLPPGEYTHPGTSDTFEVGERNQGRRRAGTGMLSGSALTPLDLFRNAVTLFGKDIATASQVCSTTAARVMGLNKGEIAIGRDADLIILDSDLELLYTIAAGTVLYEH